MISPSLPLPPTLKPEKKPSFLARDSSWLRASMAKRKRQGERGSPCLNPLELRKKPVGHPLMRIENVAVDQHHFIQLIHLCPNPILDITSMRKFQFTWSKAFSMSNLRRRPDTFSFNLESRASLAIRTTSKICLPWTKACCESLLVFCF